MVFLIFVKTVIVIVPNPHLLQLRRTNNLRLQHFSYENVSSFFNLLEVFVLLDLEVKQGNFLSFGFRVEP